MLVEAPFAADSKFVALLDDQSKKANFDATHELEELLLEDNPLKARKRNPNQDINSLSTEMRALEEQCVIFGTLFSDLATHNFLGSRIMIRTR